MSDSGGVQEEAPSLGKPVLVLRDTTERPEGVKAGTLKLVGTDPERVKEEMTALLTDPDLYQKWLRPEIHMEMGRHLSGLFKPFNTIMASLTWCRNLEREIFRNEKKESFRKLDAYFGRF